MDRKEEDRQDRMNKEHWIPFPHTTTPVPCGQVYRKSDPHIAPVGDSSEPECESEITMYS